MTVSEALANQRRGASAALFPCDGVVGFDVGAVVYGSGAGFFAGRGENVLDPYKSFAFIAALSERMNAHLPALQKMESVDQGAVPAGRFCLGEMGDRLRVVGGNFSPRRHEGTKKGKYLLARRTRSSRRGGRFVQKMDSLRENRGIFLPRRSKGAKKWEGLREEGGRLLVFGSCLGYAGVAESTSDSGFHARVSAKSTSNSGFRARVSAKSASNSGFHAKSLFFRSKCTGFDEKHPFFSENAAFFHADTLPAGARFPGKNVPPSSSKVSCAKTGVAAASSVNNKRIKVFILEHGCPVDARSVFC